MEQKVTGRSTQKTICGLHLLTWSDKLNLESMIIEGNKQRGRILI
jgi:hypothetical protein